jgi:hypothetical protein
VSRKIKFYSNPHKKYALILKKIIAKQSFWAEKNNFHRKIEKMLYMDILICTFEKVLK